MHRSKGELKMAKAAGVNSAALANMSDTVTKLEVNSPDLWAHCLPRPAVDGHKYHRGYAAIYAAEELTGATRLAAEACNRIGAGLVSVIAQARSDVYRTCLAADIMVHAQMPDKTSAALAGPGGCTPAQHLALLGASWLDARIFDAGAIPAREDFDQLDQTCIMTPHIGEFEHRFGAITGDASQAAHLLALQSGATVVLKSAQTTIAGLDGRVIVNTHTSPYLAKAGTGDVLAGLITGLTAQGMPHFEACAAAVWMHGEAGKRIGVGLIASDIADSLADILCELL
jgi:hydroxyethylthiazole kinase-like uncharacterized protein yjeF